MFHLKFQVFLFRPGHPRDRAFRGVEAHPQRSAQPCSVAKDLSAVSPDLPDILSGDTGDSHLQRNEPVMRPWKGGQINK